MYQPALLHQLPKILPLYSPQTTSCFSALCLPSWGRVHVCEHTQILQKCLQYGDTNHRPVTCPFTRFSPRRYYRSGSCFSSASPRGHGGLRDNTYQAGRSLLLALPVTPGKRGPDRAPNLVPRLIAGPTPSPGAHVKALGVPARVLGRETRVLIRLREGHDTPPAPPTQGPTSPCTGAVWAVVRGLLFTSLTKLVFLHQFRDCNPRKCSEQGGQGLTGDITWPGLVL